MTVREVEDPSGTHTSVIGAANPRLGAIVLEYHGYGGTTPLPARRRHVPSGRLPLIFTFGSPLLHLDPKAPHGDAAAYAAFVAGLHDSYALTETVGDAGGVQVDLSPVGAYLLFGRPMHELTNHIVDVRDVLGSEGGELGRRLEEERDWRARLALLDGFLLRRAAHGCPPSEGIVWAWDRLRRANGNVAIGELTDALGCSRKHLVEQFREQVGMPPKHFGRILRFGSAVRALRKAVPGRWSTIALRAGYYDQAHMIRDFNEFAGCTPTEFVARRLPSGEFEAS